ncbi:MAG: hypothetical protein AABW67_01890 [Nanoarchaeota archaeon]
MVKQLEFKFLEEMRKEDEIEEMRRFKRDNKIAGITIAIGLPIQIGAMYLTQHPEYAKTIKNYVRYLFN